MAFTTSGFYKQFKQYAISDMRKTGILASLTAAQAKIESRNGNSGLTTECNNLFGIKGAYNGQSKHYWTTEYENGVAVKRFCAFRKYPSWQESVYDHSGLFNRLPRYANLRNCQDYEEACINVKKDGYATALDYTETLMKQIKSQKLWMWDYEVLKTYVPTKLRTIQRGADGGGVYLLQTLLKANGYQLDCDGQFGGQTDYCVREYQKAHGLKVDGICGQNTWRSIKK